MLLWKKLLTLWYADGRWLERYRVLVVALGYKRKGWRVGNSYVMVM